MTLESLLRWAQRRLPPLLLTAIVISGLLVLLRGPGPFYLDGPIFLQAAERFVAGEPLYAKGFFSPPWAAMLYTPFTLLPTNLGTRLVYYLGLLTVVVSAWLLLSSPRWTKWQRLVFAGLCALFPPAAWVVSAGQMTTLMLLTGAIALRLQSRYPFGAGASLALWSIKPHLALLPLALMAVYMLGRGNTKFLLGLLTATALLLWATLWFWHDIWNQWLSALASYPSYFLHLFDVWPDGPEAPIIPLLWASGILLALWAFRQQHAEIGLTAIMLSGLYLTPKSHSYDLVLFMIPLALTLRQGGPGWLVAASFVWPAIVKMTDLPITFLAPLGPLLLIGLARTRGWEDTTLTASKTSLVS